MLFFCVLDENLKHVNIDRSQEKKIFMTSSFDKSEVILTLNPHFQHMFKLVENFYIIL